MVAKSFSHIAILCMMAAMFAASCTGGRRNYSDWQELPAHGWAYGDTVRLELLDTTLTGNDSVMHQGQVLLGLRHSSAYPYSNIWLEITYHADSLLIRDTLNMRLADAYGRWLGKGFGASYQMETPIGSLRDIDLTLPVEVRHIMRVDTLPAVTDIGVEVR